VCPIDWAINVDFPTPGPPNTKLNLPLGHPPIVASNIGIPDGTYSIGFRSVPLMI
jgi:hypothetical protein